MEPPTLTCYFETNPKKIDPPLGQRTRLSGYRVELRLPTICAGLLGLFLLSVHVMGTRTVLGSLERVFPRFLSLAQQQYPRTELRKNKKQSFVSGG